VSVVTGDRVTLMLHLKHGMNESKSFIMFIYVRTGT
jgi:hypothetical protein